MATENIITRLPLYEDHNYRYQTVLGDKKASLQFWYNKRTKAWYMNVSEQSGTSLVQGLKIIPNVFHGADFSLDHYGIKGYFALVPNASNIKYEEIDPNFLYQYYTLYYIEEV